MTRASTGSMKPTFYWRGDSFYILNQLGLPRSASYMRCRSHRDVAQAIRGMSVRGAPAIGVAAAFGVALAAREKKHLSPQALRRGVLTSIRLLAASRPTAVNLFWALDRMRKVVTDTPAGESVPDALLREAQQIYDEDIAANRKIGANGARLLARKAVVLTHCNAGALATAGFGTALGVIRAARSQGKISHVYVDETRPWLQGSRLTAWELQMERIPYSIITDNMAAHIMKTQGVSAVIVGADRIAANGDTANKIGTYGLAILSRYHRIPLYIAAPVSTIDSDTKTGDDIRIEERPHEEVLSINGIRLAPRGAAARHPAFDVTPASLITAVITEKGVVRPSAVTSLCARSA